LERMQIFLKNKWEIEDHNKLYYQGNVSYFKAINYFSDMTQEELALWKGDIMDESSVDYEETVIIKPNGPVAEQMDWRTKGAVTPVKNQGQCGSCYAFSVTGALEGQHFIKNGKLVSMSEQQILDCLSEGGCNGGNKDSVFTYIARNGGIDSESFYPYKARKGTKCLFDKNQVVATDKGYRSLAKGETNLQNAVAKVGPISVSIYVANSFFHYADGVYDEPNCHEPDHNHAVLVVGYGTLNGHDYWLVKNSWGTNWGVQGYIRMARNKNNQCSIASYGIYPIGVSKGSLEEHVSKTNSGKQLENNQKNIFMNIVMYLSREH
jgi:cathepsin L